MKAEDRRLGHPMVPSPAMGGFLGRDWSPHGATSSARLMETFLLEPPFIRIRSEEGGGVGEV